MNDDVYNLCLAGMVCLVLIAIALGGCSHQPAPITVERAHEVPVPVPIACTPPAELLADLVLPVPEFHAPWAACPAGADCKVMSGLYVEDETALMRRDALLRQRIAAWMSWGGCSAR